MNDQSQDQKQNAEQREKIAQSDLVAYKTLYVDTGTPREVELLRAELKAALEELNTLRARTARLKPVLWQYEILGDNGQDYYWQTIDSSDAETRAVCLRKQDWHIRALAVVSWTPKP